MSRLPQVKPKEVIKALEKLGFWQIRISGSHLRLINKDNLGVTVPLHNKPLPPGTLKSGLIDIRVGENDSFLCGCN